MPFLNSFLYLITTDRVRTDSTTYTTLRHSIPSGQEELILLQEKVKKGTITVDEALEKFKQWQNEKSSLEVTQQVYF